MYSVIAVSVLIEFVLFSLKNTVIWYDFLWKIVILFGK